MGPKYLSIHTISDWRPKTIAFYDLSLGKKAETIEIHFNPKAQVLFCHEFMNNVMNMLLQTANPH